MFIQKIITLFQCPHRRAMPGGMIYKFQILRAVFIALCPENRLMTVFRIILPRYEDEWFAISIREDIYITDSFSLQTIELVPPQYQTLSQLLCS